MCIFEHEENRTVMLGIARIRSEVSAYFLQFSSTTKNDRAWSSVTVHDRAWPRLEHDRAWQNTTEHGRAWLNTDEQVWAWLSMIEPLLENDRPRIRDRALTSLFYSDVMYIVFTYWSNLHVILTKAVLVYGLMMWWQII